MKLAATVAFIAVAMVMPTRADAVGRQPSTARLLFTSRTCSSLHCVEKRQRENLRHATYVCRHGGGHNRWWNCRARGWLSREHSKTVTRLRPPLPAHYNGWMCIHSHEGAWYSTNPNGPYNGLQMTWGWVELTGNPNSYTPIQILWAAEHEGAKHGFAPWWLSQQWGQTIGGCWGYF